jgi:hypothetical protein
MRTHIARTHIHSAHTHTHTVDRPPDHDPSEHLSLPPSLRRALPQQELRLHIIKKNEYVYVINSTAARGIHSFEDNSET